MNAIKKYEQIYIVKLKDGRVYHLPLDHWKQVQQNWIETNKQCVLALWDDAIDGYLITEISLQKIDNDINKFIIDQPKQIRDKLMNNWVRYNSIQHVQNYIEAINAWKF